MPTTNDSIDQKRIVTRFFSRILGPLSRIGMRFGLSAREAEPVLRWSFVHAYFSTPALWRNETPSYLHAEIKTGLPRHKVKELQNVDLPSSELFTRRQNLAYRVLERWVNDPAYQKNGEPVPLSIDKRQPLNLHALVQRCGMRSMTGPVLADLQSAGCVEVRDGVAYIVSRTYGLDLLDEDRLEIMGFMLTRLAETTDHNLVAAVDQRRLQRVWKQTLIPTDKADEARRLVTAIAIKAGREADRLLSELAHQEPTEGTSYEEIGLVSFLYGNPSEFNNDTVTPAEYAKETP